VETGTNMQTYWSGLTLEPQTQYRLRFFARSSTGHKMDVSFLQDAAPYTNYGLRSSVVDLDTNWRECIIDFTTEGFSATVNDGLLRFWFASYAADGDAYMIDDVVLTRLSGVKVDDAGDGLPRQHVLRQNYPNPFNPETKIRFELPIQEHVLLKVYDLKGEEVAVLFDSTRAAGVHEVSFDARNLSSGMYFCVLKTDSYVETRKMLMLR
jgi:hypothetical protein